MKKAISIALLMSALAGSAFAADAAKERAKEVISLKDGSTLYIFADGKSAMENKYGKTVNMQPGMVMEAKDGRTFTMKDDEVARLNSLLREGHGNK